MGRRFDNLLVYQKSLDLVEKVYQITSLFPKEEIYTLTSQLRRSAISVPSNIAEGKGRNGIKEFINFLHISLGSLYELSTQIEIAKRLNYINKNDVDNLYFVIDEIERMLNSLIKNRKMQG